VPRVSAQDERLLSTFLDLVRIDSPSRSEARCAAYCQRVLSDLGFAVRFDDSAPFTGSDTGNLIAELPGDAGSTLVLSAHLDCVQPCEGVEPRVVDGVVISSGDTVLGADDKAGLSAILETARRLVESGESRPTIRCVLTVQEEIGLIGAKALDGGAAQGDLCLVLDAAGKPGGIVIGAPTHYTFVAEVTGRAAHAGVAPETGVSAIEIVANAIASMELGRLDSETTANIGTVSGGTATNVVAARATVTGECRSLDPRRVEEVRARMHEAMKDAASKAGGLADIVWNLEYRGFITSANAPHVELVRDACADVGLDAGTFTTGGGSDANIIAATDVPTLALACGMEGVHGTSEQLEVADLEALTALTVAVARRMAREH
jgi:tripeptide aminopeptidase